MYSQLETDNQSKKESLRNILSSDKIKRVNAIGVVLLCEVKYSMLLLIECLLR